MPTLCTAGETISKGDAVCVTNFDVIKERPDRQKGDPQ